MVQPIAAIIPASHAYEGMRALMFDGSFRWDLFWKGSALNIIWLAIAVWLYTRAFAQARQQGSLLQGSE